MRALIFVYFCTFSLVASAQASDKDAEVFDRLEEITDILDDVADVAAPAADLPGTVLDAVGADAFAIVNYVGTRIAYIPYTGVLRGAEGTLRSGYGNSYDQSLALVTLLRRAGFESQILVGPETTMGSFSLTKDDPPRPESADEVTELLEELEDVAAEMQNLGLIDAIQEYKPAEPVVFDARIGETAARAAISVLDLDTFTPRPENPETYAIVRYRSAPADPWNYADPAKNALYDTLDTAAYAKLNSRVPPEHLHNTTISLVVESSYFGSVPVATLEAPSSNIANRPISFGIQPSASSLSTDVMDTFAPDQDLVFVSDTLPGKLITMQGQVISLEDAASNAGAVFRTGAGLLGDAISNLNSEDGQGPLIFDRLVLKVQTRGAFGDLHQSSERVLVDRAIVESVVKDEGSLEQAMLVASAGNMLIFSGIGELTQSEREARSLQILAQGLGQLLDDPSNQDGFSSMMSLINFSLHDQLAAVVAEAVDALNTSSSLVMIRSIPFPELDGSGIVQALATDILIDGRQAESAEAALIRAVNTAALEQGILARVTEIVEMPVLQSGSFDALKDRQAAGVSPISLDDYLAVPSAWKDPESLLHRAFLEELQDRGLSAAVWPGGSAAETVWLEYESDGGYARLASGTGAGQALTEEAMLNIIVLEIMALVNLYGCYTAMDGKPKSATYKCLSCTTAKFALGLAAIAVLPVGAAAGAITGAGIGAEFACL